MQIIIDADACPVTDIAIRIAKEKQIPCSMVCDYNHALHSAYATVTLVDKGQDSADFKIYARVLQGDVVITQDYGLASLVLSKGAFAIHPCGKIYTSETMDLMLFERYVSAKNRKNGIRTANMKKRTQADDLAFEKALRSILEDTK